MIKSYRRRREKKKSGKRKRRKERLKEQESEQQGLRRRRGKRLNVVDPDPGVVHAVERKIRENTRKEETILLIVTVPVVAADPAILPILQEVIAVIVTHHIPVEVVVEEEVEVDKGNHGEEVEAIVLVLVADLLGLRFRDQTPDRLLQANREVEGIRVREKG